MQVVFHIHGDLPDAGSRVAVLCEAPLTVKKLKSLFPFEGEFHFRTKVTAKKIGYNDCEYFWLDLSEVSGHIECEDNIVEVQALAINIPHCVDGVDNDYDGYIEDMSQYVPSERLPSSVAFPPKTSTLTSDELHVGNSSTFFASSSGASANASAGISNPLSALKNLASTVKSSTAAVNINLNTVKTGATSIWNKMKATAAHLQQQAASVASDAAIAKSANDMLMLLAKDLSTTFSDSSQFHVQLLGRLWEVQFPDRGPFQRTSAVWKLAGWQKEDPVADLKNSGLLALHSMIYLGETYSERALEMLRANQANRKNNYPFAIVGVNVTLLLAELFKLRDPQ